MLKQSYLLIMLCSFYLIACQNTNNNEGKTGAIHLLKKEVIKIPLDSLSEAPHQQNGSANEEARVSLIVMNQNLTKIGEQVFEENPQHIAWLTLGVGKTYHYAALREGENLSEDTLYLQQFELRTELC